MDAKLTAVADSALLVEFDNRIERRINEQVLALLHELQRRGIDGVGELVPSYRSLLVHYDCARLSLESISEQLSDALKTSKQVELTNKLWRIPVLYGGEAGCDLDEVATLHELSTDEVIRLHCKAEFRVYMMGFAPGWCYLGGLPERLHTPRLPSPRLQVPAGCISIGGQQGMLGALAMPSGWRLLGQTPVRSYDPDRDPPFIISAGDEIRFFPIDGAEYQRLDAASARGEMIVSPATIDRQDSTA